MAASRTPSSIPRAALARSDDEPGFLPVGLAFCDSTFPPLPREAFALGLDQVKQFDYRWGFQGTAIESIVGAAIPAPRKGLPALIDQPGFDAQHLPTVPSGLAGFAVFSRNFPSL